MLDPSEIAQYRKLDEPLKFINSQYITIRNEDRARYTAFLDEILKVFRAKMQESDDIYRNFEGAVNLAGSSYDNVKVGIPDEFDLNVVMKLPSSWNYKDDIKVQVAENPSYVTINVKNGCERYYRDPTFAAKYQKVIKLWTDADGYLIQGNLHAWMEGVVTKALNKLERINNKFIIKTYNGAIVYVKSKKSGPALTLQCESADGTLKIDVDLVPVIQFNNSDSSEVFWLAAPIRQRPPNCSKSWCAVPKPKKDGSKPRSNREWRISFAGQERDLLSRQGRVKNVIRQLKKLKSVHEETKYLPSYYVKTIFLWAMEDETIEQSIWRRYSDGALFMFMLKKLYTHLLNGSIPFYWDKRNNLLDSIGSSVINMKCKIERIIKDIEGPSYSPNVFAKHMLTAEEYEDFTKRYGNRNLANQFEMLSLDSPVIANENTQQNWSCSIM